MSRRIYRRDEIAELEAEAAALREAARARLVKIAEKVGLLEAVVPQARLEAALEAAMWRPRRKEGAPPRVSTSKLGKLEEKIRMARQRATKEERAQDARRKILLGAFLIAQFEHDPALHAALREELSKFLDLHKDPDVRAANRALLADFLEGGGTQKETEKRQQDANASS